MSQVVEGETKSQEQGKFTREVVMGLLRRGPTLVQAAIHMPETTFDGLDYKNKDESALALATYMQTLLDLKLKRALSKIPDDSSPRHKARRAYITASFARTKTAVMLPAVGVLFGPEMNTDTPAPTAYQLYRYEQIAKFTATAAENYYAQKHPSKGRRATGR